MTGLDAGLGLAKAAPAAASEEEILTSWGKQIQAAISLTNAGPAGEALMLGVREATLATFTVLKWFKWSPAAMLEEMFGVKHDSAAGWAKAFPPPNGKDAISTLRWWRETQLRLMGELPDAVSSLQQTTARSDVLLGIKAYLGESLAANIMAHPATQRSWDEILAPKASS